MTVVWIEKGLILLYFLGSVFRCDDHSTGWTCTPEQQAASPGTLRVTTLERQLLNLVNFIYQGRVFLSVPMQHMDTDTQPAALTSWD